MKYYLQHKGAVFFLSKNFGSFVAFNNDLLGQRGQRGKAMRKNRLYESFESEESFNDMFEELKEVAKELKEKYNGICPICNKRKASAIDHDHTTGKVRGYICNKCNLGLHYIEDIELKNNMEKYLRGE